MGRSGRILTGVIAVVVTLVATAQSAEAAFPGANGKIAFSQEIGSTFGLWLMNEDGTGQINIGRGFDPAWSPDGQKIASADRGDLLLMNADGSDLRLVARFPYAVDQPAWSPDGQKLAFSAHPGGVQLINPDGSGLTTLTASGDDPAWSPDGRKIAFTSFRDGNAEIYVMNADGTDQTRLTDNPEQDAFPDWSPSGSEIAFSSLRPGAGNYDIYTMNPDGGQKTDISNSPTLDDFNPHWSPDGQKFVFAVGLSCPCNIYVMSRDGSGQKKITNSPDIAWQPDWQPLPITPPAKNAAKFCKAEQERLGNSFNQTYGNFGGCVSAQNRNRAEEG